MAEFGKGRGAPNRAVNPRDDTFYPDGEFIRSRAVMAEEKRPYRHMAEVQRTQAILKSPPKFDSTARALPIEL